METIEDEEELGCNKKDSFIIDSEAGMKSVGQYQLLKVIGTGTSSCIYLSVKLPLVSICSGVTITSEDIEEIVKDLHESELYAIKTISRNHMRRLGIEKYLKTEIKNQRSLKHDNILPIIEVMISPRRYYIVMPYCAGGDLFREIKSMPNGRMTEAFAKERFRVVANAFLYCHQQQIVHRDAKPENILLTRDGKVKLADFGFSALVDKSNDDGCDQPKTSAVGTLTYAAPELLARFRDNTTAPYDAKKADIYSLGAVLYTMLTGLSLQRRSTDMSHDSTCHIMSDGTNSSILDGVAPGDVLPERILSSEYTPEVCNLVTAMLSLDPSNRPTIEEVVESSWLNGTS